MGLSSLVPERLLWPLLPNLTIFHLVKLELRNDLAKAYTLTLLGCFGLYSDVSKV